MERNCWYCHKPLPFTKLLKRDLFCSSEHEDLYLSEQSMAAFERMKEATPAKSPLERPKPLEPVIQETVEAAAEPAEAPLPMALLIKEELVARDAPRPSISPEHPLDVVAQPAGPPVRPGWQFDPKLPSGGFVRHPVNGAPLDSTAEGSFPHESFAENGPAFSGLSKNRSQPVTGGMNPTRHAEAIPEWTGRAADEAKNNVVAAEESTASAFPAKIAELAALDSNLSPPPPACAWAPRGPAGVLPAPPAIPSAPGEADPARAVWTLQTPPLPSNLIPAPAVRAWDSSAAGGAQIAPDTSSEFAIDNDPTDAALTRHIVELASNLISAPAVRTWEAAASADVAPVAPISAPEFSIAIDPKRASGTEHATPLGSNLTPTRAMCAWESPAAADARQVAPIHEPEFRVASDGRHAEWTHYLIEVPSNLNTAAAMQTWGVQPPAPTMTARPALEGTPVFSTAAVRPTEECSISRPLQFAVCGTIGGSPGSPDSHDGPRVGFRTSFKVPNGSLSRGEVSGTSGNRFLAIRSWVTGTWDPSRPRNTITASSPAPGTTNDPRRVIMVRSLAGPRYSCRPATASLLEIGPAPRTGHVLDSLLVTGELQSTGAIAIRSAQDHTARSALHGAAATIREPLTAHAPGAPARLTPHGPHRFVGTVDFPAFAFSGSTALAAAATNSEWNGIANSAAPRLAHAHRLEPLPAPRVAEARTCAALLKVRSGGPIEQGRRPLAATAYLSARPWLGRETKVPCQIPNTSDGRLAAPAVRAGAASAGTIHLGDDPATEVRIAPLPPIRVHPADIFASPAALAGTPFQAGWPQRGPAAGTGESFAMKASVSAPFHAVVEVAKALPTPGEARRPAFAGPALPGTRVRGSAPCFALEVPLQNIAYRHAGTRQL